MNNNFNITVSGFSFSVRALVTTNVPDANGVYTQRIYEFDSSPYVYYIRIPVAGNPTAELPYYGSWGGDDIIQRSGSSQHLGVYDGSSWRQNADGHLQVSFTNGEYCDGAQVYRYSVVVFVCSTNAAESITVTEYPTCTCKCILCCR